MSYYGELDEDGILADVVAWIYDALEPIGGTDGLPGWSYRYRDREYPTRQAVATVVGRDLYAEGYTAQSLACACRPEDSKRFRVSRVCDLTAAGKGVPVEWN